MNYLNLTVLSSSLIYAAAHRQIIFMGLAIGEDCIYSSYYITLIIHTVGTRRRRSPHACIKRLALSNEYFSKLPLLCYEFISLWHHMRYMCKCMMFFKLRVVMMYIWFKKKLNFDAMLISKSISAEKYYARSLMRINASVNT